MLAQGAAAVASRWSVRSLRASAPLLTASWRSATTDQSATMQPRTTRKYENDFYRLYPQLVGAPKDGKTRKEMVEKRIADVEDNILALETELLRSSSRVADEERGTPDFVLGDSKKVWAGDHFSMDEETMAKWVPEGWASRVAEIEFAEMEHTRVQARDQLLEVKQELVRQKEAGFSSKAGCKPIVLDGENGVGKSTLLTQLVYWARTNGWIVLFVPDGLKATGWRSIERSRVYEGKFDQPEMAEELLHQLLSAHGDQLENLSVRAKLTETIKEQEFSGSNWKELMTFGVEYEGVAADVLNLFREELNSVTEYPVLVVVDDYNCLFGNSGYADMDDKGKGVPALPNDRLSFISLINDPVSHGLANGTMVCATDQRLGMKAMRRARLPKDIMSPCKPYSYTEFLRQFDLYKENGWVMQDVSSESLRYIYRYTNGHPLEVYKYLGAL